MADPSDKRRYPRVASQILVRLTRLDAGPGGDLSSTRNLSLGGCTVVHDHPLGADTPLRLVFCMGESVVEAKGRTVYEIARKDGCFDLGIEFLEMPPEDAELLGQFFEPSR